MANFETMAKSEHVDRATSMEWRAWRDMETGPITVRFIILDFFKLVHSCIGWHEIN